MNQIQSFSMNHSKEDITMKKKFNIYDMVNDKIIAMLDKGVVPWQRPWHGGAMCISRVTGKPYSFLNQILLSPNFDGTLESLNSGEYATMQQINKEGGRVNKGAKSYQVVFWKLFPVKEKQLRGAPRQKPPRIGRYNSTPAI